MDPTLQLLVVAIVGGVLAQWVSRMIRMPAIVPLLALGILVGPQVLGILPRPSETLGHSFSSVVALGVGIILFDGGLHLNIRDIRSAPRAVRNLLTLGAGVSFVGAMLFANLVGGFDWALSALFGALMIVTGPTVIMPILQNLRLTRRVHTVLLWEGILIDAIGAIAAIVTMDIIYHEASALAAGGMFAGALLAGPAIGGLGGWMLAMFLKRRKAQGHNAEMNHLITFAAAVAIFGLGEAVFKSAGLAAATCAGMVVTNMLGEASNDLRRVKGTLTKFIVSVLFMLLAADFDLNSLKLIWPGGFMVVAAMILIVRPASVVASSIGTQLSWRECVFLGGIGPRGIVAASVASLFGLFLEGRGQVELGQQLVALTFLTIMATVLFSGLGAYPLAKVLGLLVSKPKGLIIVGANELARKVASIYDVRGIPAIMVDTNGDLCVQARRAGYQAIEASALDEDFLAQQNVAGMGFILSLTPSSRINIQTAAHAQENMEIERAFVVNCDSNAEESQAGSVDNLYKAMALQVDVDAVCDLLRKGKGTMRSFPWPLQAATRPRKAFLPLAFTDSQTIRPFSVDETYSEPGEVVGIEFDVPPGSAPFVALQQEAVIIASVNEPIKS